MKSPGQEYYITSSVWEWLPRYNQASPKFEFEFEFEFRHSLETRARICLHYHFTVPMATAAGNRAVSVVGPFKSWLTPQK